MIRETTPFPCGADAKTCFQWADIPKEDVVRLLCYSKNIVNETIADMVYARFILGLPCENIAMFFGMPLKYIRSMEMIVILDLTPRIPIK